MTEECVYARGYPEGALMRLHGMVSIVCPSHGVSVGRWDDSATWRLDHKDDASEEQISAALAVMADFDPWAGSAEAVVEDGSDEPRQSDEQEHISDGEQDADHGPDLAQPEPESISDIREAYEASFDDGAGEVGSDLTADIDSGGGAGEPAAASEDAGPDLPADFSAEPVGDDSGGAEPGAYPGVMVTGDPLKAAQMEATWRVGEYEAELLGLNDISEKSARLAELRGWAMAAKEKAAPDLTDSEKDELQALETFDGWIAQVRAHADSLRGQIRAAPDEAHLAVIDIQDGWPE